MELRSIVHPFENVQRVLTKNSDYIMVNTDNTILADGSSELVDISLPPTPLQGQTHSIKSIDATFACTVVRNGNNIDGAASNLNLALNVARTLQYDTSFGWLIL